MLFVFALAISSCKKDKGDDASSDPSFSAKVAGTTKTSMNAPVAMHYASEKTLQIMGQFSGGSGISIMVQEPKVGTFNVGSDEVMVSYLANTSTSGNYMGVSGNVKITEWSSSRVKGTFEFTGEVLGGGPTMVISEGKFDAKVSSM